MYRKSRAGEASTGAFTDGVAGTPEAFLSRTPIDGQWKVVNRLGGGAQGNVYLALDLELERLVAVKVLHPSVVSPARFKREGLLLARIEHEHVVRIIIAGQCPHWGSYLVTELVDGRTLKDVIAECNRRDRPLSLSKAVRIFLAVARGLVALHAQGIVHRDIKPSNIVVPKSERPAAKILDLGLGKLLPAADDLTAEGTVIGTLAYMAPEATAGRRATVKVDIYGLGVSMWEVIAGHHPFSGRFASTTATPLSAVRSEVPPELSDLIAKMMAPAARQRPKASEIVKRLEQIRDRLQR